MEDIIKRVYKYTTSQSELKDKHERRPFLHYTPSVGWMNDPNGLIYFKDKYHLFYQYHPFKKEWGQMYWGHAISNDLISWEELPIALAPSENYEDDLEGGCFSGTAIEHNGILYLFYTAVNKNVEGKMVQTQCIAISEDGVHFFKYKNNPVIQNDFTGNESSHFRDPKVWKKNHNFFMLVGVSHDQVGKLVLYQSNNLFDWTFIGITYECPNAWMLECPDFFNLDGKDILTFSPVGIKGNYSTYLLGNMDYDNGKFIIDNQGLLDYGVDFYAPQSLLSPTGERYIIGWQNGWEWMDEWNGFGSLKENNWCGAMSIPRKIEIKNNKLCSTLPVEKINFNNTHTLVPTNDSSKQNRKIKIKNPSMITLELNDGIEPVILKFYNQKNNRQDFFCITSQIDYYSIGNSDNRNDLMMPLSKKSKNFKILIDLYSIELFDNEGGTVLSVNSFVSGLLIREFSCNYIGNSRVNKLIITDLSK